MAISNNRILEVEDGRVTFRYTASDTGQTRDCTVTAEEFIRRFLQHVLPKGFVKVRYYGLFSSGHRALLTQVRRLLGDVGNPPATQRTRHQRPADRTRPASAPSAANGWRCGRPFDPKVAVRLAERSVGRSHWSA